jgi:biopolymer transport protein ExbD
VLGAAGYTLTDATGAAVQIPKKATAYDDAELDNKLKAIRAQFSKETTSKVIVTSEDGVAYKHLIGVMDVCLRNDFTGISVGSVN